MMKKILIVEDEADIRESLDDLLTLKGFQVYTAANGKEGLFMASTQKPDLILSDIMMPELNGFEFLELIQKNVDLTSIPFIFLTAKIDHTSLREGMTLGADDYLTKPVKNQELIDVINRRLKKSENIKKSFEDEYKTILNKLNSSAQHEFNTPLNGILGFAELIKSRPNISPHEMIRFAEIIELSGMRLKSTLTNIVLYRTIVCNSFVHNKAIFIVDQDFVQAIIRNISDKYKRGTDLKLSPFKSFQTEGSSENLEKILTELIDNAFKFSHKGDQIKIDYELINQNHSLVIADQGRGIKEQDLNNISAFRQFELDKFEQAGLGLGMYLSLELAKRSNWKIELSQGKEKGLIVRVIL